MTDLKVTVMYELDGHKHKVVSGRVWCSLQRGDVDVEACFYCPYMTSIDLDSKRQSIMCDPKMPISEEEKIAYQRLGVLELADALGNVSQACRERGVSRAQFYEFRHRYTELGLPGLADQPQSQKHPRSTPPDVAEKILELSFMHPDWGCTRLSDFLKETGVSVSSPTVQNILIKHRMGSKRERILHVEERAVRESLELTSEQIAVVENYNPSFRERHAESIRPGEVLVQDTYFVGNLKDVGNVYAQFVVDTFSSYAFAYLHTGKLPMYGVMILHNDVLPFFREQKLPISIMLTDRGRLYCGQEKHPYELYLTIHQIDHQRTRARRHTNGFMERFKRMVSDEFFKLALKQKLYRSIATLQSDLTEWMAHFNTRPLPGYRNMGMKPMDRIREYQEEFPQGRRHITH
jgi:transposase InsO family protein